MDNDPRPLSPELRAMLGTYRDRNPMPEAAKERVHARLQAESVVAAPARGRPIWLWASVAAVAAAALLWGARSLTGSEQSPTERGSNQLAPMRANEGDGDTARVRPEPVRAPQPRATPPAPKTLAPAEVPPPTPEPVREPPASRRKPPQRDTTPTPEPPPTAALGEENRLIARTWEQVRRKQYARAESTLAEHARQFPGGVLAPERKALTVIVDCLSAPDEAAGKADAYARSGQTTLLAKVRSACDEKKSAAK